MINRKPWRVSQRTKVLDMIRLHQERLTCHRGGGGPMEEG